MSERAQRDGVPILAALPRLGRLLSMLAASLIAVSGLLAASGLSLDLFGGPGATRDAATLAAALVSLSDVVLGRLVGRRFARALRHESPTLEELAAAAAPGGLVGMLLVAAGSATAALFAVAGGRPWILLAVAAVGLFATWRSVPDAHKIETLLRRRAGHDATA